AESNAENILNALNKQVQIAGDMGSLSYTDPQLQAFFAQDALAKGIHEMDTQITNAEKEAKLEAEREMKKKQEEWAENHPLEAWLQDLSKSAGEKWDVLRKGTKWVGDNIPLLKDLSDKALVLEGFIGAAGSAISGIAIGATKLGFLIAELGEWGFNSIRGVETEQWKLDDIYGAGNTIKSLGQAIISWQDYPKYGKALVNSVKGYVEKSLTDPYALGGAIFDIGSCFIGVGEVTAAVKGTAAFGKFAEGTKVFQAAAKSGKIVGKLEEITALMNKLPRNALEKIKNIEIPNFGPKTSFAGIGNGGGGGLDALKDAYQFMKENGEKVFGKGEALGNKKVAVGEEIIAQRVLKAELDLTPKLTPYKSLSRGQQKKIKEKIENRTVTKEEYKRYQWDKRFSKRRAAGVNEFWKQEKKRILDGEPTTRDWTNEQIQEILKGKKPQYNGKSIIGHHTYNAMNYPHICNRGELIYPVTGREHLKGWHGGSYRKNAPGRPVNPNYLEEF
ncbi:hypothetical protein COM55_26095, partial [Bacillus pseudomycoides]